MFFKIQITKIIVLYHLFQPVFLDVINESYMHNVPKGMICAQFIK